MRWRRSQRLKGATLAKTIGARRDERPAPEGGAPNQF
jgi:hypothetical protein